MEGAAGPRLSDEGHKLYRIRQTCMKMLDKRGYNVLQEHVSMTSEKFVEDFGADPKREDMTLLVEKVGEVGANRRITFFRYSYSYELLRGGVVVL